MGPRSFKTQTEKRPKSTDRVMTPKLSRIKTTKDFIRTLKQGKKDLSPHFVLYSLINNTDGSRLGIRVSKKAASLSTDRNRVKRLIRASWLSKKAGRGKDFVVVVRKYVKSRKNDSILKEIDNLFNRNLS